MGWKEGQAELGEAGGWQVWGRGCWVCRGKKWWVHIRVELTIWE